MGWAVCGKSKSAMKNSARVCCNYCKRNKWDGPLHTCVTACTRTICVVVVLYEFNNAIGQIVVWNANSTNDEDEVKQQWNEPYFIANKNISWNGIWFGSLAAAAILLLCWTLFPLLLWQQFQNAAAVKPTWDELLLLHTYICMYYWPSTDFSRFSHLLTENRKS